MKDNFSEISKEYSRFRPKYPPQLFKFLNAKIKCFERAWDCATGNGQVALPLSDVFNEVHATDISEQQIKNAVSRNNIHYSIQPAEKTNFPSDSFDLITVAQAIHWFDVEKFYSEVFRTLKQDGLIVVLGYGLFRTNPEADRIILDLYNNTLGPFWDPERRYIDDSYTTISFPFREIVTPNFEFNEIWNIDQLTGYLKTWSAVNHFKKEKGFDPVEKLIPKLKQSFGNRGEVSFPILLRLGRRSN